MLRSLGFSDLLGGFHPRELDSGTVETPFTRPAEPGGPPGGKVDLHRNIPDVPVPAGLVWETFNAGVESIAVGGTHRGARPSE